MRLRVKGSAQSKGLAGIGHGTVHSFSGWPITRAKPCDMAPMLRIRLLSAGACSVAVQADRRSGQPLLEDERPPEEVGPAVALEDDLLVE